MDTWQFLAIVVALVALAGLVLAVRFFRLTTMQVSGVTQQIKDLQDLLKLAGLSIDKPLTAEPLDIPEAIVRALQEALANLGRVKEQINANKDLLTPEDRLTMGNAYYGVKEYQEAADAYTQAIRLRPDFPEAYNNRGVAYDDLKDYPKAIADYNQALKLRPDFPETYYNRGLAYGHLEKYQEAIADFDRALELRPDFPEAYSNRGNAYCGLGGEDNLRRAIADFDRALELRPDDPEAYNNRGAIYDNLGEHDKAVADYPRPPITWPSLTLIWGTNGPCWSGWGRPSGWMRSFGQWRRQTKTLSGTGATRTSRPWWGTSWPELPKALVGKVNPDESDPTCPQVLFLHGHVDAYVDHPRLRTLISSPPTGPSDVVTFYPIRHQTQHR